MIIPLAIALGVVVFGTIVLVTVETHLGIPHLALLYLFPIPVIAIYLGSTCALSASALSAMMAAYYLLPPKFSLYVSDSLDIVELVMVVALAGFMTKITARDDGLARIPSRER